ncbi:zinc finger CCHC domain-containing protein 7 [Callorhinchus milii]|uniref:Zinc finger CCHC domain-containing protein 7 n=1 Tax=Callorhinchus milii TaxID=7868 RepID=A0A4W3HII0_CALMI|nr:zinc finger CCHC domain-containing protein 7 [Callorhinchus milii]|eukprot:gi/632962290/ref/XP_007897224.1/ PREDICTED: zinc finger CCHC domain-containing protein 7 [Callorhinchus milii]
MFSGYEDVEAYENDLYGEQISESEIDSDVEFQLYSQVHYASNLSEVDAPVQSFIENNVKKADTDVIVISDFADDDDSVYGSKDSKDSKSGATERDQSIEEFASHSSNHAFHSASNSSRTSGLCTSSKCRLAPADIAANSSLGRKRQQIQEFIILEDSDSSEEENDDEIKSWMILGHNEEEDKNLQFNIHTSARLNNEDAVQWSICDKDLQSQVTNRFRRNIQRYYVENQNVHCRNCNKRGHLTLNCPSPKKWPACCLCGVRGHLQRYCPERYCTNCNMPGHCFQKCIEGAYWKKQCRRCDMAGHYSDACPEIWRQYHVTTKPGPIVNGRSDTVRMRNIYCYNCSRRGHYGFECKARRMFSDNFPASPFVYHYDTAKEIGCRNYRIKKKMKVTFPDLQVASLVKMSEAEGKQVLSKKMLKRQKRELNKKRREKAKQKKSEKSSLTENPSEKHCHRSSKFSRKINKEIDKDFPRGLAACSPGLNRSQHTHHRGSLLFLPSEKYSRRKRKISKRKQTERESVPGLTKPRKKRKRARKNETHANEEASSGIANDLLIIKQRTKKVKRRSRKLD